VDSTGTQQSVAWIQAHLKNLTLDLTEVRTIVGDAKVVGLGESTHGTKEFYQLKLEIIQRLISEMDFSVVALEAGVTEVDRINQYLQDGNGDPKVLLRSLGGILRTQQVLDLIQWMRKYNLEHYNHVALIGCDMQNPNLAIKNIHKFVQEIFRELFQK
jgi:erythromycin esterase